MKIMKLITHNKTRDKRRSGFTLIELLVVVALIILIAGIALPTVINLFSAGADAQAYNLLAAQLAYARSQAIFLGTYVGVHVQAADRSELSKDCYSAVVWDDPDVSGHEFSLLPDAKPEKIPGNFGFGKLFGTFFNSSGDYQGLDDSGLEDFTTFTIVFSPQGQIVKFVEGAANGHVAFTTDDKLFGDPDTNPTVLWEKPDDAEGVTAVTIFNYAEMKAISPSGNARRDYMNNNWGQILALNIYTGRFFHRY